MKTKSYFRTEDDERCYPLDYHLTDAKDEGLTEIELFESIPIRVDGMFWCKAVDEYGEDGICGRQCEQYEPKNGKSGMCRHKGHFYEHGNKVMFKVVA